MQVDVGDTREEVSAADIEAMHVRATRLAHSDQVDPPHHGHEQHRDQDADDQLPIARGAGRRRARSVMR